MKERPIIFSAPMVKAILEGRKSQTRRVISAKHQWFIDLSASEQVRRWNERPFPFGRTGDRLWVRESWRIGSWDDGCGFFLDYCDGPRNERLETDPDTAYKYIQQIAADLERKSIQPTNGTMYEWEPGESPLRWRSPIHMPRWASRITLEITDVRVDRPQEISEADARAEGAALTCPQCGNDLDDEHGAEVHWACDDDTSSHAEGFRRTWNAIHGPGAWEANPWVWAISFRVLK